MDVSFNSHMVRTITVGDEEFDVDYEPVGYAEFRPEVPENGYLVHGHLHCVERVVAPRHIHIGIDSDWTSYGVPRYTPIPETAIIDLIRNLE